MANAGFEHVAPGAGLQGRLQKLTAIVGRDHDHFVAPLVADNFLGRRDSGPPRQFDVHEDHVGS